MPKPVDWETIHSRPLISVPDCWRGCGGGFCCSGDHPDFQFRLLPAQGKGTVVVYLEDEYRWFKERGETICGEEDGREIARFAFDFGGPAPLVIRHAPCGYHGRCGGKVAKPLLCRIYPFIPVLNGDGEAEETLPASIIDATFRLKTGEAPCPLHVDPGDRLLREALAGEPELAKALAHPLIALYTQAARAFLDSYRERLQAWTSFRELSGPAFWQAWELAYLGGRLADGGAVAARVRAAHDALAARHGAFLV